MVPHSIDIHGCVYIHITQHVRALCVGGSVVLTENEREAGPVVGVSYTRLDEDDGIHEDAISTDTTHMLR